MHYQGPATIVGIISGRKRQYEMEHNGKRYKGDISMLPDTRANYARDRRHNA